MTNSLFSTGDFTQWHDLALVLKIIYLIKIFRQLIEIKIKWLSHYHFDSFTFYLVLACMYNFFLNAAWWIDLQIGSNLCSLPFGIFSLPFRLCWLSFGHVLAKSEGQPHQEIPGLMGKKCQVYSVMTLFITFCCAVCLPGVGGEAQLLTSQMNKVTCQETLELPLVRGESEAVPSSHSVKATQSLHSIRFLRFSFQVYIITLKHLVLVTMNGIIWYFKLLSKKYILNFLKLL